MGTKNLLSLRRVSREWNELAITTIRRHHSSHAVAFKTSEGVKFFMEQMERRIQFRIPFSSFCFHVEPLAVIQSHSYGHQITSLSFELRYSDEIPMLLLEAVRKVPNLKKVSLDAEFPMSLKVVQDFVSSLTPSLQMLNIYHRVTVRSEVEFARFLESVESFESVSLNCVILTPLQLPSSNHKIAKYVSKAGKRDQLKPNLKLSLQPPRFDSRETELRDLTTRLIEIGSQSLKTLRLNLPWSQGLPYLGNLEHIALRFQHRNPLKCTKLNPADFPCLKRVSLCYACNYPGCDNEFALLQTPFGEAVFKTVNTFSYKSPRSCMDLTTLPWHDIFPNLTTFRYYDWVSDKDIAYIETNLTQIQHLAFHYGRGCPNIFLRHRFPDTNMKTTDLVWPFHGLKGMSE